MSCLKEEMKSIYRKKVLETMEDAMTIQEFIQSFNEKDLTELELDREHMQDLQYYKKSEPNKKTEKIMVVENKNEMPDLSYMEKAGELETYTLEYENLSDILGMKIHPEAFEMFSEAELLEALLVELECIAKTEEQLNVNQMRLLEAEEIVQAKKELSHSTEKEVIPFNKKKLEQTASKGVRFADLINIMPKELKEEFEENQLKEKTDGTKTIRELIKDTALKDVAESFESYVNFFGVELLVDAQDIIDDFQLLYKEIKTKMLQKGMREDAGVVYVNEHERFFFTEKTFKCIYYGEQVLMLTDSVVKDTKKIKTITNADALALFVIAYYLPKWIDMKFVGIEEKATIDRIAEEKKIKKVMEQLATGEISIGDIKERDLKKIIAYN